jgi:hypothetical protein
MLALRLLSEGGGGPNTELLWIVSIGVAFFFLVIAVGWLTSGRKQEQAEGGDEASKSVSKKESEKSSKKK